MCVVGYKHVCQGCRVVLVACAAVWMGWKLTQWVAVLLQDSDFFRHLWNAALRLNGGTSGYPETCKRKGL